MTKNYFLCFLFSYLLMPSLIAANSAPKSLYPFFTSLLAKQWELKKIFVETMSGEEVVCNEFGRFDYEVGKYDELVAAYKALDVDDKRIAELQERSKSYSYQWNRNSPQIIQYFTDSFEGKLWVYMQLFYKYSNSRTVVINAANKCVQESHSLSSLNIWHAAETMQLFLTYVGKLSVDDYKTLASQDEFLSSLDIKLLQNSQKNMKLNTLFSSLTANNLVFVDDPQFNISLCGNKKAQEKAIIQHINTTTILGYCKGFPGFFDWAKELQEAFYDQVKNAGYKYPVHEIPYNEENYKIELSLAGWGIISGHILIEEEEATQKAANEVVNYASKTKDKLEKYLQYTSIAINSPYNPLNCKSLMNITLGIRISIFEAFLTTKDREKLLFEAIQKYSGMHLEDDWGLAKFIKDKRDAEHDAQHKERLAYLRKCKETAASKKTKNIVAASSALVKASLPKNSKNTEVKTLPLVVEKLATADEAHNKQSKQHPKKKKRNRKKRKAKHQAVIIEQEKKELEGYPLEPVPVMSHDEIVSALVKKERKERKKSTLPLDENKNQMVPHGSIKINRGKKIPSIKKIFKCSFSISRYSSIKLGDYFPRHFLSQFQSAYERQQEKKGHPKLLKQDLVTDASRYLCEGERALKTLYEERLAHLELTRTMSDRRLCRQLFLSQLGIDGNGSITDEQIEARIFAWYSGVRYEIDDKIKEHARLVNSLMADENLSQQMYVLIFQEMSLTKSIFLHINNLDLHSAAVTFIREQFLAQENLMKEYYDRLNEMLENNDQKYSMQEINSMYSQKWLENSWTATHFQTIFSDESEVYKTLEGALRDLKGSIFRLDQIALEVSGCL